MIVTKVPIADLKPDPGNARQHGPENLATITDSLTRWGQIEPLIVRRGDRLVVGGNGRLEAMNALGWKDAEVVELDLTDEQVRRLSIQLNRSSELATWDDTILAKTLAELRADGDLIGVGFEPKDLDERLRELGLDADGHPLANIDVDDAGDQEILPDAVSKRGEIWHLGAHRLMCGDSSSESDIRSAIGPVPGADLVVTSPPYNCGKDYGVHNDSMPSDQYLALISW